MSSKRAQQWCQNKNGLPYFETSAKDAINVEQAFKTIARNALSQESDDPGIIDFPPNISLGPTNPVRPSGGDNCAC